MSERQSNRAAFPETASLVDELRDVFGPGVKLVWADENGRQIGQYEQPGVAVPLSRMVLKAPDVPVVERSRRNPKGKT